MPNNSGSKPARGRILDPRLSRHARATRSFIFASAGLGALSTLLLIAQAWLLATVIAGAFSGRDVAQLTAPLLALLAVVLLRALLAWGSELVAARCSLAVKRQLRRALLSHLTALGPDGLRRHRTGEIATLASHGLDALDAYFSLYLPQLLLAVIAPVAAVLAIAVNDWISAAIVALTLPLIPVFMGLVGATTRARTETQLRALQRLAAHFLDVVSGLPTLKVFGRSERQIDVIRDISERQRTATMSTLRVTFLSSLILELVATISVALVAVAIGLRLLNGDIELRPALLVLVLAPEAYLPLRVLGANYHASAEGVSAAEQVFAVLDQSLPPLGRHRRIPDLASTPISVVEMTVRYPGRDRPALDRFSLQVEPQQVVAVTGPSGSGKSTLLGVLLGFVAANTGSVQVGERELAELALDAWRERIAWLPQRPHLFATSIAENIRLARPGCSDEQVRTAAYAAGLTELLASRPDGLNASLGERGAGVSAGERQRIALARAFVRDAPLVLLDEPTANLDGATEEQILLALSRLIKGRTAILIAHRPAVAALADRVVDLDRMALAA